MRMSIKERGKSWEKKIVQGSETVGRDVERAGKELGHATRDGMTRIDDRLRPNRQAKADSK